MQINAPRGHTCNLSHWRFLLGFCGRQNRTQKSLMIILGSGVIIFPLLGSASNFNIFVILSVLTGFLYGSIWTVMRAAMTALCPKEKLNFGFSFYTLGERVSTLIGPLSWGLITYFFVNLGPTRYRIAVTAMAFLLRLEYCF